MRNSYRRTNRKRRSRAGWVVFTSVGILLGVTAFFCLQMAEGTAGREFGPGYDVLGVSRELMGIQAGISEKSQEIKEGYLAGLYSPCGVLINRMTGEILEEKDGDKIIYPASLTKIMTALLALENLELQEEIWLTDEMFQGLYTQNASMAGFLPGENISVEDLLYGVLLPSGAECCIALAEKIAGSEGAFAEMMNSKGAELGMENTHFCNSTGLHNSNHCTTVKDMGILLRYALENKEFREIFTTQRHTTGGSEQNPGGITFQSTILGYADSLQVAGGEILGGKTGYTEEAGLCLASLAKINGREYILVTGKAAGSPDTEPCHLLDAKTVYSRIEKAG